MPPVGRLSKNPGAGRLATPVEVWMLRIGLPRFSLSSELLEAQRRTGREPQDHVGLRIRLLAFREGRSRFHRSNSLFEKRAREQFVEQRFDGEYRGQQDESSFPGQ